MMEDVDMIEISDNYSPNHTDADCINSTDTIKQGVAGLDSYKIGREILQARRKLHDPSKLQFIFIIDTNIVISHLELKTFMLEARQLNVTFVIPFVVIQELDILKHKRDADHHHIAFIHQSLTTKNCVLSDKNLLKLWPQNKIKAALATVGDLTEMNNDDKILKTSLVIKELTQEHGSSVYLITDDVNLSTKAIATDLDCMNWTSFTKLWTNLSSKNFTLPNNSHSNKVSIKLPHPIVLPSRKPPSFRCREKRKESQEKISIDSDTSMISSSHISDGETRSKKLSDLSTEALQEIAKDHLVVLIKKILQSTYKELWDSMFKIDLNHCTLLEALDVLKRGWIGVFSDAFNRNKATQNLVTTLVKDLRHKSEEKVERGHLLELIESIQAANQINQNQNSPSERLSRVMKSLRKRKAPHESSNKVKYMHIDPIRITI